MRELRVALAIGLGVAAACFATAIFAGAFIH
jgi:hypothetical protein